VRRAAGALLAGLVALPGVAGAQRLGARALAAGVWTTTSTGTDRRLSGAAFGFEAAARVGPAALGIRYIEGSVANDSAGIDREFAEADVTLWARPVHWGAVGVGPHVRSFVAPGGTERWLLWEIRGRGSAGLRPGMLDAYLEGWLALGGDVDVPEPFNSGRGVEGGLELTLGRLPLAVRLRYRVERINLGDGARRETTEHLVLGLGLGRL
jgi:hypothetical protein